MCLLRCPPPLPPLVAPRATPLSSSARMWGTTRSSRSTVSYSRIRETATTTTDLARPSNTTMCARPSPPTTTRGALLSITTAKGPKAAPKVRKCGPRRCVRGCVVPGVDQMGLWGALCWARVIQLQPYVYGARACTWGTTVRAAGRAHACTLSRGAASIASKITTTGREAAVEQRSGTTPRRCGARRAFGPRFRAWSRGRPWV